MAITWRLPTGEKSAEESVWQSEDAQGVRSASALRINEG